MGDGSIVEKIPFFLLSLHRQIKNPRHSFVVKPKLAVILLAPVEAVKNIKNVVLNLKPI